ncbi:O-antigen ligase family protein [Candidatus Woesebacteria bacterium]|nr:O-antigen ligase family protein [Candidatus Woesebacteria bacterium]
MKHGISSKIAVVCAVVLLFTFPLGNLLRIVVGSAVFYPHDLVLLIWLAYAAVFTPYFKRLHKISFAGWLKVALIWTGIGMIGALIRTHSGIPFLYVLRLIIYILGSWSLTQVLPQSRLKTSLVTLGLVYQVVSFGLYLISPDMRFLWVYGWDDHYYRLIGTIFDPGFTGMLAILTLLTLWSLPHRSKIWQAAISLFLLTCIILTYSRASYLALIVALICMALQYKKRAVTQFILGGIVCLVLFWLAPKPGGDGVEITRLTSITARLQTIQHSITSLTPSTALLGTGLFSRFSQENNPQMPTTTAYFPDNIIILLLVQTGFPGLVLWSLCAMQYLKKLWKKRPLQFSAAAALFMHAQFNNTLLQPFVLLYFLYILMDDT